MHILLFKGRRKESIFIELNQESVISKTYIIDIYIKD